MGRTTKYDTNVKPRLNEIRQWAVFTTEEEIARRLHVTDRTFRKYKHEHPELQEAIAGGVFEMVTTLKEKLFRKACGYEYTEKKTTIRGSGDKKTREIVEFTRWQPEDIGAIHLLLKNYDPAWRQDDMTTVKLKQEKQKLEKEKADQNSWT